MNNMLFLVSLISASVFTMNLNPEHSKEIRLPARLNKMVVHKECDCGSLPAEHFCGSSALLHALMTEMRYGLRPKTDPLAEIDHAFNYLNIPRTQNAYLLIKNLQKTAKYLGLNYNFIQVSKQRNKIYSLDRDYEGKFTVRDIERFKNSLVRINYSLASSKKNIEIYHFFICFKTPYKNSFDPHVVVMSVVKNNADISAEVFDNLNYQMNGNEDHFFAIETIANNLTKKVDKNLKITPCLNVFRDEADDIEDYYAHRYKKIEKQTLLKEAYFLWKYRHLESRKINIKKINNIIDELAFVYLKKCDVAKELIVDIYGALIDNVMDKNIRAKQILQCINFLINAVKTMAQKGVFLFEKNSVEYGLVNRAYSVKNKLELQL